MGGWGADLFIHHTLLAGEITGFATEQIFANSNDMKCGLETENIFGSSESLWVFLYVTPNDPEQITLEQVGTGQGMEDTKSEGISGGVQWSFQATDKEFKVLDAQWKQADVFRCALGTVWRCKTLGRHSQHEIHLGERLTFGDWIQPSWSYRILQVKNKQTNKMILKFRSGQRIVLAAYSLLSGQLPIQLQVSTVEKKKSLCLLCLILRDRKRKIR